VPIIHNGVHPHKRNMTTHQIIQPRNPCKIRNQKSEKNIIRN